MMRRSTSRRAAVPAAALAIALSLGLSACAASSENTTAALRESVVQIAERSAAGDYAGALAELALLDRDVTTAAENGSIDSAREQQIRTAMELVRAELETADVAPATTPTRTPTPTPDDDEGDDAPGNSDNKGKGNTTTTRTTKTTTDFRHG